MSYPYPRNTVWFIEAKSDGSGQSKARSQHGSAIAVRLSNSETQEPKNYLLTCLHVVCRIEREKSNGVVTDLETLNHISCWPPGHGFNDSQRLEAKLAFETQIPTDMLGRKLLIGEDWVLLEVSEPSFQKVPVARAWDDPVEPLSSKQCDIIGYPAGSEGFAKGIVESLHLKKIPISREGGDFYLTVDGDGTREGMSGGGVFTDSGILIGVHRSAQAPTNALYAVRTRDIRDELGEKQLEPVKRPLAQALLDGAVDVFVKLGLPASTAKAAVISGVLLLVALLVPAIAAVFVPSPVVDPIDLYRDVELENWLSYVEREHDTDDFDLVLSNEEERLKDSQRYIRFSAAIYDISKDTTDGIRTFYCSPPSCTGLQKFPSVFEIEVHRESLPSGITPSVLAPAQGKYRVAQFEVELDNFNWKKRAPTGIVFATADTIALTKEEIECASSQE